ncbi:MAG: CDP-diacylglycerol--glycerol-3-phosphate 3-phosphatidyltransferase [Gammaproteobacteria bacterium]|nr:MAG: CDP-diacylglycerol--glycerol-3-phosphate 3-phosphatidyltransferase [Gammaproteobacteria bacterium]
MFNLPNILSLLRIALIPVLIGCYFLPFESAAVWATIIFAIASLTDWLDGYLARKWDQTSAFGAFIDPVADKLIVSIALLLVLYKTPEWYVLIPVIVIIAREITISALREWMAAIGEQNTVKVSFVGKLKTSFQMLAIGCLIFDNSLFGLPIFDIGIILLYIASVLTISSMWSYLRAAWPVMKSNG